MEKKTINANNVEIVTKGNKMNVADTNNVELIPKGNKMDVADTNNVESVIKEKKMDVADTNNVELVIKESDDVPEITRCQKCRILFSCENIAVMSVVLALGVGHFLTFLIYTGFQFLFQQVCNFAKFAKQEGCISNQTHSAKCS